MSISQAIHTARTGLQISGLQADLVATNVANASTPGYVRRSLNVSEVLLGQQSNGVRSDGVSRSTDATLSAQRRLASSDQASASVLSSTWDSISTRLGSTTDGPGLFNTLSNLETTFLEALSTPESTTGLANLLAASKATVSEFKQLSDMVTNLRAEADQEIAIGVDRVNTALEQIEFLNRSIAGLDRTTNEAAALFDERDRVLDTISEYLPIQTVERDSGTIDVLTKEGVYLVAGAARQIEFTPSTAFGADQTVENGDLSGLSIGDVNLTPGATSFAAISSGMFGALFQLRDRDLTEFNGQLDALANDLVTRMSVSVIDPTTAAGDPGLFIDSGTAGDPGIAGRLAINAAVDPENGGALYRIRDGINATTEGPPGNGDILNGYYNWLLAPLNVSAGQLQGTYSLAGMAAEVSSLAGYRQVSADALNSSTQTQLNVLRDAEIAETGVDIDNQMQDLLLIEQSYAANARVIEVASQMINRLMEL